MSEDIAKERFIQRMKQKTQKGKDDALAGNEPSEFTKAYIEGYKKGMAIKENIIEQEWND